MNMSKHGRNRKQRFFASGVVVVFAYLLGPVDVVHAQVQTGVILGSISDESQGALPGVTATLSSPALPSGPATVVTDETGQYRFPELTPGTYALELTLGGFATYTEEDLRVTSGGTTQRDVTMNLGGVEESITVTGQSPMVDTRAVSVGTGLAAEVIELLPSNRYSRADIEKWVPGVHNSGLNTTAHGPQVLGSANFETSFLIDGAVTNHPGFGGSYSIGDADAYEELQLVTLGASAEYQHAQGGVSNAIIKSGTNVVRGDWKAIFSPDTLTSKPIKLACNCPLGETGFTNEQTYDVGGHVGGPVIPNRLWYFGGIVYWYAGQAQPGTDPKKIKAPSARRFVAKVTSQLTDTVKLTGMFHDELWTFDGTPTVRRSFESTNGNAGSIPVYAIELTKTFARTFFTVRGSGWYFLNRTSMPLSGDLTSPYHLDRATGRATNGTAQFQRENGGRHMLAFKVNRVARVGNTEHNIKFGAQEEFAFQRIFAAWPSGVQFRDLAGAPDEASYRDASSLGSSFNTQGVWAEDVITRGRMTLSLGARWDRLEGTSRDLPVVDNLLKETGGTVKGLGSMFTWTNTLSPRVGLNIRLTQDGRTILRSTYGRYYRAMVLGDFNGVHPGVQTVTRKRWDVATGGYTTLIGTTNARDNIAVDPNMVDPSTDQFSVGIDHELMNNMAVTASYIYKYGRNIIGWRDIGGIYGEETRLLQNGQSVTVFPLLNSPSQRLYQRTNGPGFYSQYNGVILGLRKRLSEGWLADVSYTYSKTVGLHGTRAISGRDPNDLINLDGRLINPADRPHSLKFRAAYQIPNVDMTVSAAYADFSGTPVPRRALVSLPQGRRFVNIEPTGATRTGWVRNLDLMIDKTLTRRGGQRMVFTVTAFNVLQNQAWDRYYSSNFFSPNFNRPSSWASTRRATVAAKMYF